MTPLERTERASMADDDRQPPQAYDTVSLAGVGATTTNQMSSGAFQDLYLTGDQGLLDVAVEEMPPDALHQFLANLGECVGNAWGIRPLHRPLPPPG